MAAEKRLAIVAWISIAGGALSLVGALASGKLELGTGLLTIPAGVGLLRKRSGWRTYALVVLWVSILVPPLVLIGTQGSTTLELEFFGRQVQSPSTLLVIAAIASWCALASWQLWTLLRPDVRGLFEEVSHETH
jgi:hypothetical protein